MRCEVRGQEGAASTAAAAASTTTAVQVEVRVELAEVAKPETGSLAIVEATRRHDRNWGGPPEMTALRRSFAAPAYKSSFVLLSLLGLLLRINPTIGGICWSSISNGRCKELLSQGVTREDCCASNAAAATAYSDEDLDSGSLFFWRVLGGGVQCRPCRESCAEVKCEEGKKCVVRRGRPRCVCSPECKAPRGGGPVCGTDGRSYKSLCRLKKRACKKGSHELAVAYTGHCQSSCARVRCGQGRSCLLDQNLSPHCVRCARRCPQAPSHQLAAARPVCGADGNTYKSACHLRLAACRAGRAIPVAYKGHCKQNADCTTIRCREGQTCLTEIKSGRPRCVTCTYRCPRKRERVRNRTHRDRDRDRDPSTTMLCATNNITYPSWCHIVKDACVTGFVLETRHAGPCNAYDTSPLYIGEQPIQRGSNLHVTHTHARTHMYTHIKISKDSIRRIVDIPCSRLPTIKDA
ncbi:follistatin-A-like isoform X1 [Vespa mandarinia]|uniref:follistatin-A-like isoform X1 n=1 Tax=Vespa mandarinia TaxID=7446 RepID=UPI001611D3AE|nr:follistatin-A-like isoform X1 [Vespa mandarinia]XP_035742137.1 follistatin-A-like isoform X1 [Vespa mandarinia]XP_035742138.1 follistatin-A-like isoform X1 [Vespa mandarinia]XP_035742139.1 follistatin-A-like isoform X1 [Vespa mandarinia]